MADVFTYSVEEKLITEIAKKTCVVSGEDKIVQGHCGQGLSIYDSPDAGEDTQETEEGTSTQDQSYRPEQKRVCPGSRKSIQRYQFLKDFNESRAERSAIIKELLIKEKERDPMDVFFESIAATVKTLPPHLQIYQGQKRGYSTNI
ncbi:hypothetical protein JTE90_029236 [Oedothorax gibbosus]|uniref:BESS domain-containing protein n=1 Tax=Oedothorax gibbosus TaxID=931172 RepID=A0AAV6TVR8_9ARAC|nr:hypothetical protein JTE90_029236 [Oedothorax gibbosus]